MALFRFNYNKPGLGGDKNEPRKKGVRRLGSLIRDFGALVKLNLLFLGCALPSMALFLASFLGFYSIITFLLALLAVSLIGGALSACMFFVTRRLRDDPGYVWDDFKRKFLEAFKQAMMPGILCSAFVYMQILVWSSWLLEGASRSKWTHPVVIP